MTCPYCQGTRERWNEDLTRQYPCQCRIQEEWPIYFRGIAHNPSWEAIPISGQASPLVFNLHQQAGDVYLVKTSMADTTFTSFISFWKGALWSHFFQSRSQGQQPLMVRYFYACDILTHAWNKTGTFYAECKQADLLVILAPTWQAFNHAWVALEGLLRTRQTTGKHTWVVCSHFDDVIEQGHIDHLSATLASYFKQLHDKNLIRLPGSGELGSGMKKAVTPVTGKPSKKPAKSNDYPGVDPRFLKDFPGKRIREQYDEHLKRHAKP